VSIPGSPEKATLQACCSTSALGRHCCLDEQAHQLDENGFGTCLVRASLGHTPISLVTAALHLGLHVRPRGDHRLVDDLLDLRGLDFADLGAFDDVDAGFALLLSAFAAGQIKRHPSPEGA
jgi:hypothetical protein